MGAGVWPAPLSNAPKQTFGGMGRADKQERVSMCVCLSACDQSVYYLCLFKEVGLWLERWEGGLVEGN